MKKSLLLFFISILSLNSYSQINFDKGYYLDNSGKRITCLIKNSDWIYNPTNFEYKLSENDEIKTASIVSVMEFGIENESKFIRATVDIDRSEDLIRKVGENRNPVFEKEQLFLKVLIEGDANLYSFQDRNFQRFFFSTQNSYLTQLIFKKYKAERFNIATNEQYKQQLLNALECSAITLKRIESLNYSTSRLTKLFVDYNECKNSKFINYNKKLKQDLFNLTIRPRLNSAQLNLAGNSAKSRNVSFETQNYIGLGLEFEYILPFNKNKWSISIDPNYQSYKQEKTTATDEITGGFINAKVIYNSIEIPLTIRHYLFLNNNSKIFINISYVADMNTETSVSYTRVDGTFIDSRDIDTKSNLAFGIGYKFLDMFSIELRQYSSRDFFDYDSNFKNTALILGYTVL